MKKLVGLQWARALAALTVVIGHAVVHPMSSSPAIWHLGARLGVVLFFVISGYIMVITTGRGPFDPLGFLRKRLFRVAPLYYVATLTAVLGVLIVPTVFKDTVFDGVHIAASLLFIPMVEPGASGDISPFFKLGWTLNYEMFFYVVFAALFALSAGKRAVLLALALGSLIVLGLFFDFAWAPLQFYTRPATLGFAAGVVLAVMSRLDRSPLDPLLAAGLLAVAATSIILLAVTYPAIRASAVSELWLVATCTPVVLALARAPDRWVDHAPPLFAYLGDASYSIYLFHMFAIGVVYAIASRVAPAGWDAVVAVAAAIGGTAAGAFVYAFIESPMTRAIHRLTHRDRSIRPAERLVAANQDREVG